MEIREIDAVISSVQELWAKQSKSPTLDELLSLVQSKQPYERLIFYVWMTDCEERRNRSEPPPDWKELCQRVKVHPFGFLYIRLLDTVERLKALWADHEVQPNELATLLPRGGDPHQRHIEWFSEYIIHTDKQELFVSPFVDDNTDNPNFELRYRNLVDDLPSDFELDHALRHSSLLQVDYSYVSRVLEQQHQRPTVGPWRLGDYDIIRKIGQGGNAKIYLARETRTNCEIALKVPTFNASALDPGRIRSVVDLLGEANKSRTLRQIPGVVKTYHVHCPPIAPDMNDDQIVASLRLHLLHEPIAITMDYIEGMSLRERLESERGAMLDLVEVATLMHGTSRTLAHLHQARIVHRDLKPENVILNEEQQPVLCDLGLAVNMTEINRGDSFLRGTRLYLSPEQTTLEQQVTSASDIWALGVMMYEASTGHHPFQYRGTGNARDEILRRIREVPPESLRVLNPEIDADFDRICLKCLKPVADQRYSALDLQEALAKWLKDHGDANALPLQSKYYAWNPVIYSDLLEKAPVFFLVEVTRFSSDIVCHIQQLLRQHECMSYRIYEVFGSTDFIVRGYFSLKQFRALQEDAQPEFGISSITKATVKKIIHHWYWGTGAFKLPNVHAAMKVKQILGTPHWELQPEIEDALAQQWVRIVEPAKEHLLFFVFLKSNKGPGPWKQSFPIASIFQHVIDTADACAQQIFNVAVYELDYTGMFGVVKAETRGFFAIDEFVSKLNEGLALSECATMTCVASSPHIVGEEDIDDHELQFPGLGEHIRKSFPRAHRNLDRVTDPHHAEQIEQWIIQFGQKNLRTEYMVAAQDMIDNWLACITEKRVDKFIAVINAVLGQAVEGGEDALSICRDMTAPATGATTIDESDGLRAIPTVTAWLVARGEADFGASTFEEIEQLRAYVLPEFRRSIPKRALWFQALSQLVDFHSFVWELNEAMRRNTGKAPFTGNDIWK